MKSKRIVIISGSPGSGKSSISKRLAEGSTYEKSIHMHTDDFYDYIRKGYIFPWLLESNEQNKIIIEAFAASVARMADGGYDVIVDGIVLLFHALQITKNASSICPYLAGKNLNNWRIIRWMIYQNKIYC